MHLGKRPKSHEKWGIEFFLNEMKYHSSTNDLFSMLFYFQRWKGKILHQQSLMLNRLNISLKVILHILLTNKNKFSIFITKTCYSWVFLVYWHWIVIKVLEGICDVIKKKLFWLPKLSQGGFYVIFIVWAPSDSVIACLFIFGISKLFMWITT